MQPIGALRLSPFFCLRSPAVFERKGRALKITDNPADYLPGDVVTWDLGGGYDHIGMVTNLRSDDAQRYLIVHNISSGAKVENVLFAWRITGHYRYF